jgi:superfamily II DNA or RNA helicase
MSLVNAGTFEGLIRSLDSDPLRRGKQFEKITKWWLQNDPIHSRDVKKVWLWDEWPDRPGRDIGVDLVAEMRDGSLCAIQSKCFDMGRDIPKSELDSFVSAASTRTFKHRWLVASTDGLSANARRMLRDNHVTQILFSYLDSLEGFWPASFDALGGTPTLVKASPRPHQQDAIRDVVEGLSKVSRGQLIMACGTGKTLTALWITEALEPSTTLVLVPSLSLLSQTLSEWAKNANTKWDYLCVCSDETVNKSEDAPISTTDDLPFDVTTKPADIAAFLERRGRKIIFSTYQSSAQVAKAQKTASKKFDLVICDEAHRLTGKNDAEFATALDDTKIPAKKRLFMTATPRTYTASVKAKAIERGVEITSMDDENMFGKELHKLSFGQAIEKELLTDYRVVIVGVTDPQVQELIDQRELVSVAGTIETDARTLAAHIGLAKATKEYDLKRTISFHGRIKTAQQFAQQHAAIIEWMPEDHRPSGSIWADTITGAMNSSDRRKLLNKLKADVPGQHALLSNARCLTEGIDVPSLDGVAFIDPRSSQVDIIQAVGRAIRKARSKSLGTIVLPVLIPHDADADHALQDSAFKPIWAILNALRSHDEEFASQLSQLRTEIGMSGIVGELPNKIEIDLPVDINHLIPDFSHKLQLAIIEQSTAPWEFWFGLLQDYVNRFENSFVPHTYLSNDFKLGFWVNSQRTKYKTGSLLKERIAKLESIPQWTWNQLEHIWETFFDLLVEFTHEFGNASVPSDPKLYKGQKLWFWTQMQRTRYKDGSLEQDRIAKLETLSGWTWSPKDDVWDEWLELLNRYIISTGSSRVAQSTTFESRNIGRWVSKQRSRYRKGNLERDRIELLEAIEGWTWEPDQESWALAFSELTNFEKEHGHAMPPQTYEVDGIQLGSWVSHQRMRYNKGKLSKQEVGQFESLTNWSWDPLEESWDDFCQELQSFAERNGEANPPKTYKVNDLPLGAWASRQRVLYRKGKLRADRIARLEEMIGWTWDKGIDVWESNFIKLTKYTSEFGTANPPQSFRDEYSNLGIWVNSQRVKYRNGRLSAELAIRLESLRGWTWNPLDGIWESSYEKLLAFTDEFKHASVPVSTDDPELKELSGWISRQRQSHRQKTLDEQKIKLLESLPGWSWKPHDESWEMYFQLLNDYQFEFGHVLVPKSRSRELFRGHDLATWVNSQRTRYKKGGLEPDRVLKLETVDGWSWDPRSDNWDFFYRLLVDYSIEFGHAVVPQGTAAKPYKGENLSRWVNKQRTKFNKGILEKDRVLKLEQVKGWKWRVINR